MENATKIHNDFTEALTLLIKKFHAEHPSLFVDNIDIIQKENLLTNKIFLGVRVKILVQPYLPEDERGRAKGAQD